MTRKHSKIDIEGHKIPAPWAAGNAAATTHAFKAIADLPNKAPTEERDWQFKRLPEPLRALV